MNKYEAETIKQFSLCGELVTAKRKIAYHINSEWIYSAHWKDETWIEQAKNDCLTRIGYVEEELRGLRAALKIIESIEVERDN